MAEEQTVTIDPAPVDGEPVAIGTPTPEPSWRDQLPEDLATLPTMEKFNGKGFEEVVRSYVNLEQKMGGNPIVKPGENGTEEQWNEYFSQIGRPSTADEYELAAPENVPEGFNISPEYEKSFKQAAFETGASAATVKSMWDALQTTATGDYNTAVTANKTRLKEAHEALEKKWGAAYPEKVQQANRAAERAGGQELLEWMKKTGANKETILIEAFAAFGGDMKEDTLGQGTPVGALTPREAKSKVAKIMANKDHPYNNKNSPGHKEAITDVEDLFKFIYPDNEPNMSTNRNTYEFGVK